MKITFVMPWHISERGGGSEVQANYLAEELKLRGYEVSYVCQTATKSKINSSEVVNGYKVVWLKPSGRFAWLDQNKYQKVLNKIHPDVVLQRMTSNVSYPIGKYCDANNKVFHWFCTDNEVPFNNWHIRKIKQRISFKISNGLKYGVFSLNALIMDYYRNKGMQNVNVAWSQNRFQKEQLQKTFGLKTHTMITGHPSPKIENNKEETFKRQTLLWCGNLGKHKRPELFVKLARQMESSNLKFVMVGGHSNQNYVDQLFSNKPTNLQVKGKLSFEEALLFFDNTSLLVNTSVAEGFSNTYIQAWLRGVPTLVMGADPNNVISTNSLGYNCSDIIQLKNKVQSLLQNKEDFVRMSEQVKHYAEQHHSIKVMTDNFVKHLDS